jgi:hypothetical protein
MAFEKKDGWWYMTCDWCGDYLFPPDGDYATSYRRKGTLINAAKSAGWIYYPTYDIHDDDGYVIATHYELSFCCQECDFNYYCWACEIENSN